MTSFWRNNDVIIAPHVVGLVRIQGYNRKTLCSAGFGGREIAVFLYVIGFVFSPWWYLMLAAKPPRYIWIIFRIPGYPCRLVSLSREFVSFSSQHHSPVAAPRGNVNMVWSWTLEMPRCLRRFRRPLIISSDQQQQKSNFLNIKIVARYSDVTWRRGFHCRWTNCLIFSERQHVITWNNVNQDLRRL